MPQGWASLKDSLKDYMYMYGYEQTHWKYI